MAIIISSVVLAAVLLASPAQAQISAGYATYSNGNGGVCSGGGGSLPSVSVNAAQFSNGAACGQCIQITGNGNGAGTSPVSTAPYVAQINNVCPQCSYGDIDLQESGNGKYGISWSFVSCPGGGRKLIETPFQGDTTVYTGFAHMGLTADTEKSTPAPAPEPAAEETGEQSTEQTEEVPALPEVDTEAVAEATQEASVESTQEETVSIVEDTSAEASLGHLEADSREEEEVVQSARKLLMSL